MNGSYDEHLEEQARQWLAAKAREYAETPPFTSHPMFANIKRGVPKRSMLWMAVMPKVYEVKSRILFCFDVLRRGVPDRVEW